MQYQFKVQIAKLYKLIVWDLYIRMQCLLTPCAPLHVSYPIYPTPCAPPHIPYTPPHVPHPIYHMPHPLVYLCPPTVDVIANVSFIVVIETSQCVQSAAVEQHIERHTFKRNGPGSYGRQWSVVPNDVTFSWKTTPCS